MSIPEYARANFSTLLRAAACGDLALLDCAVTGEPRYVIWPLCRYRHNGHWTGAPQRLNRDPSGSFGSAKYAFEELVGELGAAFTCASLGIVPAVRHTDYVGSCWTSCAKTVARQPLRRRRSRVR